MCEQVANKDTVREVLLKYKQPYSFRQLLDHLQPRALPGVEKLTGILTRGSRLVMGSQEFVMLKMLLMVFIFESDYFSKR